MRFLFTVAAIMIAVSAAAYENKALNPFAVRGGLPNVAAKLEAGKPVKIAYFGGSITAQNGWRPQTLKFLQEKYPKSAISQIHAAIGGTGSNLGALRVNYDVIRFRPDLVFVEFAVNDNNDKVENIYAHMEGIVRQIWRELPETDIIFVYTITAGRLADYQKGELPRSASAMEDVAAYYQIPMVDFGYDVAALEKEGKLVMKTSDKGMDRVSGDELNVEGLPLTKDGKIPFSGDGVHPNTNTGHVIYTNQFIKAWPELVKTAKEVKHELGKPMVADCLEKVISLPLDSPGITLSGPATKLPDNDPVFKNFKSRIPAMWKLSPGATIEFKFRGTRARFFDLVGPGSGSGTIEIDGQAREFKRIDPYCTYWRLSNNSIFTGEDGLHHVKITVSDKEIDKRKILFEKNRADFDKNPEKYAPLDYYVGTLFIVGELEK